MISYTNRLQIDKPKKEVFDFLTIPANWSSYIPSTIDVKPIIETEFSVNKQVTEYLSLPGKVQIHWTCTINDTFSNYVIEGKSDNFGGSTSKLSLILSENEGKTEVERKIILKQNNLIMRIMEPISKLFFIFEAKVSLKKAKSILESNS